MRSTRSVLSLAVAAALVVAACGDDDDDMPGVRPQRAGATSRPRGAQPPQGGGDDSGPGDDRRPGDHRRGDHRRYRGRRLHARRAVDHRLRRRLQRPCRLRRRPRHGSSPSPGRPAQRGRRGRRPGRRVHRQGAARRSLGRPAGRPGAARRGRRGDHRSSVRLQRGPADRHGKRTGADHLQRLHRPRPRRPEPGGVPDELQRSRAVGRGRRVRRRRWRHDRGHVLVARRRLLHQHDAAGSPKRSRRAAAKSSATSRSAWPTRISPPR